MKDMFGSVRRSLVFCSPNGGGGDEGTTVGTLVVKQSKCIVHRCGSYYYKMKYHLGPESTILAKNYTLLDGRISQVGTKQFQTMEVDIQACRTNTGAPQRKIGGFGGNR
ncbi:hypothetical protein CsSME_00000240 [Camellia sinensis var. sinensis]